MRRKSIAAETTVDVAERLEPDVYTHVNMVGNITALTGLTFSYADLKERTLTLLPLLGGSVYLPSTQICGRFRHCCVEMIKRESKQRGRKLSLLTLYWLYIGGVKESVQMDYDLLIDSPLVRDHIFGGFWGCSEPLFTEKKVQIEDARPSRIIRPETVYGQRTDPIQRGEVKKEDPADTKAYFDWIERLKESREGRKAKANQPANGKTNGTPANGEATPQPLQAANMPHSRQIIPIGTDLTHNIDILRPTKVQMGMLLAMLRYWSNQPYFGARAGRNMGLVDLTYEVEAAGLSGTIKVEGRKRTITMSEPLLKLETLFWDQFDSLDFTKPDLRSKKDAA